MSKIAVNEITNEAGTGAPSFNEGINATSLNGGQFGGRRNLIINGAMQVAQRGTITTGVTSSGYYACDRWLLNSLTEDTVTISQSTDAPNGFSNSLKLEVTSADSSFDAFDYAAFNQRFEGQDLQNLAFGTSDAKTLTLSFWVKSSVAGTYAVNFQHDDANLYYCKTYTIDSANTWEQKTISVDPNTSNGFNNDANLSLTAWFLMTAGSGFTGGTEDQWVSESNNGSLAGSHNVNLSGTVGNEFYLTGVQLEVGDTATPFEHRSYGEELALCQRYFEIVYSPSTYVNTFLLAKPNSSAQFLTPFMFQVEKRASPSLIYSGTPELYEQVSQKNVTSLTGAANKKGGRIRGSTSDSLTVNAVLHLDVDTSSLTVDAEL